MSAPAATNIPVKDLPLSTLADEYAIVRQRMMRWKPNVNPDAQRFSELAQELLERHEHMPPEMRFTVAGDQFTIPISPQENRTKITKPTALYRRLKKLGERRLLVLYKITLDAIRKAIPDEKEQRRYLKTTRTGPREIGEPVLKQSAGANAA